MKERFKYILSVIAIAMLLVCCSDGDEKEVIKPNPNPNPNPNPPVELTDNEYTNYWIYERMSKLYYWNDKLPASPIYQQEPKDFFESILYNYKQVTGDRFSWIEADKSKKAKNLFANENLGFDCIPASYFEDMNSRSTKVGFFVITVKRGSDAEAKGLKRGNVIYAVNGTDVDYNNYTTILNKSSLNLSVYNSSGVQATLNTIYANYVPGSPVYKSDLVDISGTKVGYVKYDAFERGTDDAGTNFDYDIELINSIKNLYNQGATELVLDLRNNPGGYAITALDLASALVPNRNTSSVFAKYKYNSYFQDSIVKRWGANSLNDYFIDKVYGTSVDIPSSNLSRLFVIANEYSASASEMVINGLRPYFKDQLVFIGETTVGKDQASITVQTSDSRIKWQLQPIVAKLKNAEDQGDYTAGLQPDVTMYEWAEGYTMRRETANSGALVDFPTLSPWKGGFKDFGDPEEPLFGEAIARITGQLPKSAKLGDVGKNVSTLEFRKDNYKTIIDEDRFERLEKK